MGIFCGEDDEPLTFELNMFRAEPVETVHALSRSVRPALFRSERRGAANSATICSNRTDEHQL